MLLVVSLQSIKLSSIDVLFFKSVNFEHVDKAAMLVSEKRDHSEEADDNALVVKRQKTDIVESSDQKVSHIV